MLRFTIQVMREQAGKQRLTHTRWTHAHMRAQTLRQFTKAAIC